jgi:hypothetical protein
LTVFNLQLIINLGDYLKRKRERGTRAGAFWKKKGSRGVWSKGHLLPPFTVQNRERGDWAAAGLEEGAPAALPIAAAGKRLKMERRQRGFYSRAHLELAQRREVDRREGSGAAAMLGGRRRCGARGKGEGCCEAGGGEVRRHGGQPTPFIGGGRWFGGGRFFRRARLRRARAASRGGAR